MYVELHCHSAYSFADGASLPEELAAWAERLGYPALALTDHNGLYGAMEFAQQMRGRELQPITGAEVTLEDGSHLTLLAENAVGYAHLSRLLSLAHLQHERGEPRVREEWLRQYGEGWIVLTGCGQGAVGRAAAAGDRRGAAAVLRRYREWFGPQNLFVELQHNLAYGDRSRLRLLTELARSLELGVVATNNVHYHRRERHRLQDALVAIRHRTTLDQSHHLRRPNSEFYLHAPQNMVRRYRSLPEAVQNTLAIAERCRAFDLTQHLGYAFPDFHEAGGATRSAQETLTEICRTELRARYGSTSPRVRAEAARRLAEELDLVRHHQLAGFFLVHRDILELAREAAARVRGRRPRGRFALPPGRGRGSSVSSIICYLIGLSPVDPVQARLNLGRFLNRELASIPDIDLDFPRDIREELIRAVHQRYGEEHVAMVGAFPTYRIRSAVRNLGLALGLPAPALDRLAKLSEGGAPETLETELARLPELASMRDTAPWRHLIELARELRGFPQYLSQHVGGIILSSRPLVELTPVENSRMEGRRVCQWDKDSCDDARFIKIDFLSLGTLSAVEDCLDLIVENGKPAVDLSRISFHEKAVYDRICAGETIGVFQIESRAQIQMLPRVQPRSIEDLTVEVAIVRPGPISGGAVNAYVQCRERMRRNPRARPRFDHPLLQPVLQETLGAILYQDQVLEVCQALAGFTVGRAEALRRAMSRRRSREMLALFQEEFLAGAAQRGAPPRIAARVFDKVMGFSGYGFPKAHAASFAILAYQTAWLSHHYPAEYFTGILNQLPMGFYPRDVLVREIQRRGIEFRGPDVNAGAVDCTVQDREIRLGLRFIQGIGRRAAEEVVAERERRGKFRSLTEFLQRVPLPCGLVENLILAGAFDAFGLERRELLWELGLLARAQGFYTGGRMGTGAGSRVARRQSSLFLSTDQDWVALPPLSPWERMLYQYRLMDLCPDTHPLALLRRVLPKGLLRAVQLPEAPPARQVRVAGLVVTRQRPETAKGVLFLLLEDETGLINAIVSPQVYERRRAILRGETLLILQGVVQNRHGTTNVIVGEVYSLIQSLRDPEPGAEGEEALLEFLHELRAVLPEPTSYR